ncbi:putative MFS family arabinose efflux permease [Kitasatospora gansuensis]|uniref:Putative MFS family arabinose efflux permease n=1 Tax=Kitasatospora gansuensis TaxID=258050 RepID=A0A7W7SJV3_9ACTN|nr:MFS transporter [Kitasatospora gansuensis]MBB4950651.1 putative MFS family arabinose efflux permease [Kitasatospora gansuensis]
MSRPSRGSASYRAVLTLPHAPKLFTAAMLARLSYGVIGLPLLLALYEGTGSYAVAGTVAGLFGLVTALLGPARARLVERRPGALTWLSVSYTLLLAALATACAVHVPSPLLAALAVLTGAFPPPVGPLMRTLWGRLAADEAQRQSALSLDTAAESTVFALGPLLGGFLVAALGAPAAVGACTLLVLVGFGLLASALRGASMSVRPAAKRSGSPLRAKGFGPLLLPVLGTAAAFTVFEIAIVAARGTVTAGVLTTLFAVGGVLGGLVYGGYRWRGALRHRPVLLVAAAACCYAVPALDVLPATAAAALFAGACADVLLITAYQLVEELVPEGSRTEAGAWVNTAYNLGSAFGAAAGGVLVDRAGPTTAFGGTAGALACCAVVGAVLALGTVRRRTAPAAA